MEPKEFEALRRRWYQAPPPVAPKPRKPETETIRRARAQTEEFSAFFGAFRQTQRETQRR